MSQFGLTFDAWGRRFACDNRHHLRHAVIDARYLARNPHLAAPELLEDVSELEPGSGWAGSPVHPLSANWTNMPSHAGRFTSACGVFIYTGDLLPEPHRGAAFTCEPSGNLVHEEVLRPHGATFRSRPARPGVEFLASASTWFRPVDLACGPDGALYVADMARAVVEHPAWLPGETANRLDFLAGKERGRIWRIVPRGAERGRPPPAPATVADQVALLSHPSGWWRATAHRLLLQSAEPLPVAALAELVRPGANPHAALHAAWLFAARDGPGKDGVLALLASAEPRLRAHGLILAESRLGADADVEERALALARDPDAAVRFQAALTLGAWQDERVLGAWREIAAADAGDRWTRLAIASGAGGRAGRLIAALFRGPGSLAAAQAAGGLDLLRELAVLVGSRRDTAEAAGVIAALEELAAPDPRPWRVAGLAGLAEGARRRGTRVDELLAGADAAGGPGGAASRAHSLMAAAGELARETGRGPAERIEAVRLLAHAPWEEVSPVLAAILAADPVDEARIEAARALAAHAAPGVAALLLAPWEGAGRALRAAILDGLVRDPARALELLAEVEAGRIQAADLGSARIDRLLEASREDVQAKARGLLAAGPPAERREVLARYQRALAAGGADPVRGRAVFAKHCAPCHRLLGTGVLAGPDIGDLSARAPEALLSDILDPNRAIDASYVSYTVTTRAGETLSGIIQAETPAAIVLRGAEGKTDAVLRADIAELRSSGASLMPEGLEQAISEREMADLIALLKGWRELDPATAGAPGDRAGTPFSGK
jgi:putative heme-binding domain-containing protein